MKLSDKKCLQTSKYKKGTNKPNNTKQRTKGAARNAGGNVTFATKHRSKVARTIGRIINSRSVQRDFVHGPVDKHDRL